MDDLMFDSYADVGLLASTFLVHPQEPYNGVYIEGTMAKERRRGYDGEGTTLKV